MGILSGVQLLYGAYNAISGSQKLNHAMDEREANLYKTPEEINDAADLSKYLAQGGYDAITLNYLTNNIKKGSANALSSVERMGGDVNDVSGILDKEIEGYMRVGADNAQQQFKNFGNYVDSLKEVAKHKDAEWQDQTNFLKDQMQAAASQKQAGMQSIMGGVNTASSAIAMDKQAGVFDDLIAALGGKAGEAVGTTNAGKNAALQGVLSTGLMNPAGNPNINESIYPSLRGVAGILGKGSTGSGEYTGNGAIIDALLKLVGG